MMAKKYRTTRDVIIPAGAEVTVEPPQTREYHVDMGSIVSDYVEESPSSLELLFDIEDALEVGLIEEVPEGE